MKIMLDTNIIISAALFPHGTAAKAFIKAMMPPYEPIICDYVIDELRRIFREKFPDRLTELEAFLFNAMLYIRVVDTPEESFEVERRHPSLPRLLYVGASWAI